MRAPGGRRVRRGGWVFGPRDPGTDEEPVVVPASGLAAGRVLVVEVLTTSGRAAGVEFRSGGGWVEVWLHGVRQAVIGQHVLREWLHEPGEPLVAGPVVLSVDRMVDVDGRVAITLPDVRAWTLAPAELDRLRGGA